MNFRAPQLLVALALLLLPALTACRHRAPALRPPVETGAPRPLPVGRILEVDTASAFVVVELHPHAALPPPPRPGEPAPSALARDPDTLEPRARLALAPWRQGRVLIFDLQEGSPRPGDEVALLRSSNRE